MQAVILAGGEGRRLKSITGDTPKPLVEIAGRPLLDHQLSTLRSRNVEEAVILVGYGAERISNFVGDGSRWGMKIRCIADGTPRGTAGAMMHARQELRDEFLVVYGDTIFDIDIERMVARHRRSDAVATLLLHPNDHPSDSDIVETDENGYVCAFHPYPHPDNRDLPNLVNAGMYFMRGDVFDRTLDLPEKPDFGKHLFPLLLASNVRLLGYNSPEYIKDAGTPDRHSRVENDIRSGRVVRKSLATPCPAVFLDRDGTINVEIGRVHRPEDLVLLPRAGEAVKRLNRSDYRTVIVTNQGVVARGDCDESTLTAIHNRLATLLGREHAFVDALYSCIHMPESGFPGERTDLKIDCECRKPKPGLVLQAAEEMNIDIAASWIIGDSTSDLMLGQNCGMKSVLVRTGHAGRDQKYPCLPDFECRDLDDAVSLILERWPTLSEETGIFARRLRPGALVLLGGQAHSGKSSWASALKLSLTQIGHRAVVVPADCWLRPEDERTGPSVLDRYDLAGLGEFVRKARGKSGTHCLSRYDRASRRPIPDAFELTIGLDAIIIVEGVPVLASSDLRDMADLTLYLQRPLDERRTAFFADYVARSWDQSSIERLWDQRCAEEMPLIESTRPSAQIILGRTP